MNSSIFSVIVTYNGSAWIKRCLGSFENKHNIIVVDNGSQDDTIDLVKNHFPEVHLIESEENLGFGAANNIGIKQALKQGANFIFLLNQDAWIEKGTLDLLVDTLKKNTEYGVISPIHLNGTGEMLDRNFGDYLFNKEGRKFITDKILCRSSKTIVDVEFVNAAAWLLSRKCIEKVGLFDPLFFHYGEDSNYLQRTIFHNFKVGVVTESFIYHDRENRKGSHMKKDFSTELRMYKKKWADVNRNDVDIENDIRNVLKIKKRNRNKKILFLKILMAKKIISQIIELNKVAESCQSSRLMNRKEFKNLKQAD